MGSKLDPFELYPQNSEQQKQKLDLEVSQIVQAESTEELQRNTIQYAEGGGGIRAQYIYAEDLALREIQAGYGIPINRQLQAGPDLLFDGLFVLHGTAHIIEIKYTNSPYSTVLLKKVIGTLLTRIDRYRWKNVRIIIVIVYGNDSIDISADRRKLVQAVEGIGDKVEVRCYGLTQLAEKFGAKID